MAELSGLTVAILATDGFEQDELFVPKERFEAAGATCLVVAPDAGKIRGWKFTDWDREIGVDKTLGEIDGTEFDALMLPGGQINPDKLRLEPRAVALVRKMVADNKPVAAICHAPWLLIEAGVIAGRRATSYWSIKTDMRNAGADWVDEPAVVDRGIVTSRYPDDLDAFCDAAIAEFAKAKTSEPV